MKKVEPVPGWYNRLSSYFRRQFGAPVFKIPLAAGFTCPNRDGTLGSGGCIYCYNPAFSPAAEDEKPGSISEQIQKGKLKKNKGAGSYLAYFQAYTSTYGALDKLKALYDEALADPEVIGLSVSTRPDCASDAVLDLLQGYTRRAQVWIEYGLQSSHNATLVRISRQHTFEQFGEAVGRTRGRGIHVCAHVILGLPGENRAMMLKTMGRLNECAVDGVKFHHLQVIRGTPLAEQYLAGDITLFETAGQYIPLLCDCLELLNAKIVIHRLAAQVTRKDLLLAPRWSESPTQIAAAVEEELKRRGTWQGIKN